MLILGTILFGITALLLIIIVLVQCGSRDKDTSTLDGNEHCRGVDESLGTEKEKDTGCKIDVEEVKKPGSLEPDKLALSSQSRLSQRSVKSNNGTQEGRKGQSSPDASVTSDSDASKVAVKAETKGKGTVSNEPTTPADSKTGELKDEGSRENSGSGDGIYTKVKPVAEKKECAYSVVNIASSEIEYEMVDGKLRRKQVDKDRKIKSDYESVESNIKPDLDPVLFAVEDSGASGIYEHVPDAKVSLVQNISPRDEHGNSEAKPQEGHDEHKKKWGLTRFSLKKRKSKRSSDSLQDEKHLSSSPEPPGLEKQNPSLCGSSERLNILHGKSETPFPIISARPKTSDDSLPPLPPLPPFPPMENRKLKTEHRRTFHEMDSIDGRDHLEKTRTLSGTELGSLAADIADDDCGNMYEIPDRNVSKIKLESDAKGLDAQRSRAHGTSPKLLHREVPKPPVEHPQRPTELPVTDDDIDAEFNENYDTISSSMVLGRDIPISPNSPKAENEKSGGSSLPTDHEYATVHKREKYENETKELSSKRTSKTDIRSPGEGGKIEILVRRTTISSNARDRTKLQEVSKEVKVVESTGIPASSVSDEGDGKLPSNLRDLYAEVNFEEKRLEQAKRALYATVDKPKTGKITLYRRSSSVENQEELEGGHYSRIKDNVPRSSSEKTGQLTRSEYEELGADDLQAVLTNLGSSKRAETSTAHTTSIPNNSISLQGNADYEVISQRGKHDFKDTTSKQGAISSDYEEISSEKFNIKTLSNQDDYVDIEDLTGCDFKI